MTDFPDLKFKALVNFPANVVGGAGVDIGYANGTYSLGLAYDDFAPAQPVVPDPDNQTLLVWDSATDSYTLIPLPVFFGANASNANPLMNGVAAPGVNLPYSREDHVHPTDITRAPLNNPVFTGDPRAPTPAPGDNDTSVATTAFVTASFAPINNPVLTGDPQAPTPAPGDADTSIATTAFVAASYAPINNPTLTGDPKAPTAAPGDNDTSIATTAFVTAAVAASSAGPGAVRYDLVQNLTVAQKIQARANISAPFRGHLFGLTLSTAGSSASFGVALGAATDNVNLDLMTLAAAITKTNAAWAVGSGNGALDTGAIAAFTWYHVFLIKRVDTGVVDVLVSLSPTAPTLPTNYTQFRRIGSLLTSGSNLWMAFTQVGDLFLWSVPVADVTDTTLGLTAKTYAITVPTGVQVLARLRGQVSSTTVSTSVLVNAMEEAVQVANTPTGNYTARNYSTGSGNTWGDLTVRTNTSAQIRAVASLAATSLWVDTYGWIDDRGRSQ